MPFATYSRTAEWGFVPPGGRNRFGEIVACGDDLLSVDVAETPVAQRLADALEASGDWLEAVAGLESVVVQFDAVEMDWRAAEERLKEALEADIEPVDAEAELVEIPVVYGGEHGPDLEAVCERQGLTVDEVIALHTGSEYTVELVGFTPGFVFIGGLDERLDVPRLEQPRQRLDAGSVGIAGSRTGVYALAVPGGWHIIGRTPMRLFGAYDEPPNRLTAGMRVRFVAVEDDGA